MLGRGKIRVTGAQRRRTLTGGEVAGRPVHVHGELALVQRRGHVLSASGATSLDQCGQHPDQSEQRCAQISQRKPGLHRGAAGFTGERHEPSRGLRDHVVTRLVAQWAFFTERRDVQGDQVGIPLGQCLVVEDLL